MRGGKGLKNACLKKNKIGLLLKGTKKFLPLKLSKKKILMILKQSL